MYCEDSEDREDLFQEIVLQLWLSFPRFRGESKLSTWMYRIGLNTAITRLRKKKRRPLLRPISAADQDIADKDGLNDVGYARELQHAIALLNKFDRALMMLYLEEKSYKEMAEIMEISESNVGVKINRIKQKLKTVLNP